MDDELRDAIRIYFNRLSPISDEEAGADLYNHQWVSIDDLVHLIKQYGDQRELDGRIEASALIKSKGHDWDDVNEGTVYELNKYIAELDEIVAIRAKVAELTALKDKDAK